MVILGVRDRDLTTGGGTMMCRFLDEIDGAE